MMKETLINLGLSEEECEEFGLWAFGNTYRTIQISQHRLKWNELHGKEFYINGDDSILETIKKMIDIWKNEEI